MGGGVQEASYLKYLITGDYSEAKPVAVTAAS